MGALGHIIFTEHAEWIENEIWHEKILINALESKLRPFEVYPYVYIGKPSIYN